MKGLLYKDITVLCKQFWVYLVFAVIFSLTAAAGDEAHYFSVYTYFIFAMLPSALLNLEISEGWASFAGGLPVSKRTLVGEKYLLGLALTALAAALSLVCGFLGSAASGTMSDLPAKLFLVGLGCGIGIGLMSIQIFAAYWLGPGKGHLLTMLLTAGMAALIAVLLTAMDGGPADLSDWLLLLPAVLYVVSWRLSVAVVERRDP